MAGPLCAIRPKAYREYLSLGAARGTVFLIRLLSITWGAGRHEDTADVDDDATVPGGGPVGGGPGGGPGEGQHILFKVERNRFFTRIHFGGNGCHMGKKLKAG